MISRLCGRNIEKGKYVRARCPLPVLHFHFIQSTISLPGTHLFHRKKCEGKPQRWDSCGFPNVHTRPQLLAAPLKMCPPPSQTHARSFHTLTIETSLLRTRAHAAYCTHTVINSPATRSSATQPTCRERYSLVDADKGAWNVVLKLIVSSDNTSPYPFIRQWLSRCPYAPGEDYRQLIAAFK